MSARSKHVPFKDWLLNQPFIVRRRVPKERTPADFAIEFGEYLAKAAEAYMEVTNAVIAGKLDADEDTVLDHYRALESAIYEFQKRAARVAAVSNLSYPLNLLSFLRGRRRS